MNSIALFPVVRKLYNFTNLYTLHEPLPNKTFFSTCIRKILRSGGNSGKHIDVEREKAHILYGKDEIFVGNEFSLVFRSKS